MLNPAIMESIRPLYVKSMKCIERGYKGTVDKEYDLAQSEYYSALEMHSINVHAAARYFQE